MANVIAKFLVWKTAAYCAALIGFGAWFLCLPLQAGMPFANFLESGRYERLWPLGVPGGLGAVAIGVAMSIRLLLLDRSALYEKSGRFILISPFWWSVKISDISEITKFSRNSGPISVNKIRILLNNGREKFIGTAFLDEDWDIVINKMKSFLVL